MFGRERTRWSFSRRDRDAASAAALNEYASGLDLCTDERQAAWLTFSEMNLPLIFPREVAKVSIDDLAELVALAGIRLNLRMIHPLAYLDSEGWIHLPGDALIELAKRVARVHHATLVAVADSSMEALLARIDDDPEIRYSLSGDIIAFALMRRWAESSSDESRLDRENARLRTLVVAAAQDLEQAGLVRSATSLRSVLD